MREEAKDDSHKQANPRTEKHVQSRTSSRNKNMKSIKKKKRKRKSRSITWSDQSQAETPSNSEKRDDATRENTRKKH
jgi:hypothetical protein